MIDFGLRNMAQVFETLSKIRFVIEGVKSSLALLGGAEKRLCHSAMFWPTSKIKNIHSNIKYTFFT